MGWSAHGSIKVSDPIPGRVLFVGAVGLLKGSHYLAEATRSLQRRRIPCEVRVGGDRAGLNCCHIASFQGPRDAGQVPRGRVVDEFLRADVFVLPTLCDSFASGTA